MGLDLGGVLGGLLGGGSGGGGGGGLLGGLGGLLDPLDSLVGGVGQALGLPPMMTDAMKLAGGLCTGDVMMAIDGGSSLLKDASQQQGGCSSGGSSAPPPCATQYQPCNDEASATCGYASSGVGGCSDGPGSSSYQSQELNAFTTLQNHFEKTESEGALFHTTDGKLTYGDLVKTAQDPSASPELKRAAGWVLGHPEAYQQMARSSDGPGGAPYVTQGDLEHAIHRAQARVGGSPYGADGSGMVGPPPPPAPAGYTGATGSSSSCSNDSSGSDCGADGSGDTSGMGGCGGGDELSSIINSNMDIEQKIEMVLQKMSDRVDGELQQNLQQQDANDQKNQSSGASSQGGNASGAKDLTFQMQQLQDRKKQLSDTLSTIAANFNDMKKLEIQNMGRA